jgi:hypothetical protein
MMLGILASAIRRGIEEPPTEDGIQFLGATTRSKPLEDTTTTQFVFPLPAGTKIGDTLVLWLQGFQYDPDRTGWRPYILESGSESWGARVGTVTSLSDVVIAANASRCVATLMVFSGAGSAPTLRRTATSTSISPPSGTHPAGPTLPAGGKYVIDTIYASSASPATMAVAPYPAGELLINYSGQSLGTTQTHSTTTAVGSSQSGEYTPPAAIWNIQNAGMVAIRLCLYAG